MNRILWIVITALVLVSASCATRYYAFDEDYNGLKFDEYSDDEIGMKTALMDGALVFEDFSDNRPAEGFVDFEETDIRDGALISRAPADDEVGQTIRFREPGGFESVAVCWKRTSSASKGHLILWVTVPGFGMPTYFNDPHNCGAHIHLDSLGGDTEEIGGTDSGSSAYILQEVRVENDEIVFLKNGQEFARYAMDKPRSFDAFSIGNNIGGEGLIDYIVVK